MKAVYVLRHFLRILAKGANVDDRIVRIIVDVGDRRKDPLDAQRASLPRRDLAFEAVASRSCAAAKAMM